MAILLEIVEGQDGQQWLFECPGCKMGHSFRVTPSVIRPTAPVWDWNGDQAKPTFSPSLLCRIDNDRQCHCYVRNGMIEFLGDCWHELRGQTVPLPEIDV